MDYGQRAIKRENLCTIREQTENMDEGYTVPLNLLLSFFHNSNGSTATQVKQIDPRTRIPVRNKSFTVVRSHLSSSPLSAPHHDNECHQPVMVMKINECEFPQLEKIGNDNDSEKPSSRHKQVAHHTVVLTF
jgi:hypothetical protein